MKTYKIIIVLAMLFAFSLLLSAQNRRAENTASNTTQNVVYNGLPIVSLSTENGAEIASKINYIGITSFAMTDNANPANNIFRENALDKIRGRGNDSWVSHYAIKKSYRLNFKDTLSFFGLTSARNWVLLAQHRDETLLYNTIAFELGKRLGLEFNHSYNFVDLYVNGEYRGNYLLTEHRQVAPGRIEIDKAEGWFVELDDYYDSEPKFRTKHFYLPVMIKSPTGRRHPAYPAFEFVRNDMNALTDALASSYFPENGYRELVDIKSVAVFMMVNEIVANTDLSHPRSTFIYKDKDSLIKFGPLWDFDSGYGWNYDAWLTHGVNDHFNNPNRRPHAHPFFRRFYEDPEFIAVFRDTWNAHYDDIASMVDFIDEMADKLEQSANLNFQHHWYKTMPPFTDSWPEQPIIFRESITKLKNWYRARVHYLNREINSADEFPPPPVRPDAVHLLPGREILPATVDALTPAEQRRNRRTARAQ